MSDANPADEPQPVVDSSAVELPASAAAPTATYTAPSFDGHGPDPSADPLEQVKVLAAERPEVVVGAAFAGGVLAAMILRRLGN